MTTPDALKNRVVDAARRHLGPTAHRLGVNPGAILRQRGRLAAQIEQTERAQERLEAYLDRVLEQNDARLADAEDVIAAARSIRDALSPEGGGPGTGAALTRRLDEAMLHAEARAAEARVRFERELADLRSTVRLTQALVDRAFSTDAPPTPRPTDDEASGSPVAAPTRPSFDHPVPSFDILYRAFEDRHRGGFDDITARQREDYLDLLTSLPNQELPIVDLGCGRGELITLLDEAGSPAIGVDANLGQISDNQRGRFEQADLFRWLDQQADGSCRSVVSLHVVEHLPADLQLRLVFESRRVLAPGGALVLETPNTLSLNIGAANFWVDPTHERPVHPLFLEFLAREAGFSEIETRPLHPIPAEFPSNETTAALVDNLNSLILGAGDLALVARR